MRESPKAAQAFSDYVALGGSRSLEKLAVSLCLRPGYAKSTPRTLRRLLQRWSAAHGWQARLVAIAEQERAAIVARGIADRQNRVDALNDRWERMRRVVDERAADPEMQSVAGGRTGLLVHKLRVVGTGRNALQVDEYEVDTSLLAEMRATEKQAAQELGQWVEKLAPTDPTGEKEYQDHRAELERRLAGLIAARTETSVSGQPQ